MELTLPLRGKIKGKINGIELKFLEIPCFEFAPFGQCYPYNSYDKTPAEYANFLIKVCHLS